MNVLKHNKIFLLFLFIEFFFINLPSIKSAEHSFNSFPINF